MSGLDPDEYVRMPDLILVENEDGIPENTIDPQLFYVSATAYAYGVLLDSGDTDALDAMEMRYREVFGDSGYRLLTGATLRILATGVLRPLLVLGMRDCPDWMRDQLTTFAGCRDMFVDFENDLLNNGGGAK